MDTIEEKKFFDDWEGDRETKAAPALAIEPDAPVNEPAKVKEAKKVEPMPPDLSAEILIGAIDTTQALIFGAINKAKRRKRFTGIEIAKAEKFLSQIKAKELVRRDLPDEDYDLVYEYEKLKEVYDDIPFTDEEYNILQKPLAKYIELNGYDIPPGIALAIAASQVFAPRIVDALFE